MTGPPAETSVPASSKLIEAARDAHQRLVDELKAQTRPLEADVSERKELPELIELQKRLRVLIEPDPSVHQEKESTPNSLDFVQWPMVDEKPADYPPSLRAFSQQKAQYIEQQEDSKEKRRKRLQEEADKCLTDLQRPYLRSIINGVPQFIGYGALKVQDWRDMPEELNLMINDY